jgi:HrpA-like RNA helicase
MRTVRSRALTAWRCTRRLYCSPTNSGDDRGNSRRGPPTNTPAAAAAAAAAAAGAATRGVAAMILTVLNVAAMAPPDLPIAAYRSELQAAVAAYPALLVIGETGSGKTTQLPQYLLMWLDERARATPPPASGTSARMTDDGPAGSCIAVTQPRRLAAVAVATRVAEEQQCALGTRVGYTIRFEDVTSAATRITYMTDGILVRACMEDPTLRRYAVVVLDEAHERSLETDILFCLLKRAVRARPELKLVVMSATLDAGRFSEYFDQCPVFTIPGRVFEVAVYHNSEMDPIDLRAKYVQYAFDTVMYIHRGDILGDVLVFLTGAARPPPQRRACLPALLTARSPTLMQWCSCGRGRPQRD